MSYKHVRVLEDVISQFEDNSEAFICYALNRLIGKHDILILNEISDYVRHAIWPNFSLGGWLVNNGHTSNWYTTTSNMKVYRIAYCKYLINEMKDWK